LKLWHDFTYQVTVHLAKRFQRRRFFRNQPIRNKNCLCLSCLLTDRDKMSNLYRGPSIDATYHVSVHLARRFRSRRFVGNLPISNMNCLCWPCLLTDPKHFGSVNKHGQHRQFVLLIGRFLKQILNLLSL
jgi:hypothetical protein